MIRALPTVGVRANVFNIQDSNLQTENTSKQLDTTIEELNKIQKTVQQTNSTPFNLGIQASLQIATEDLYLYPEPLLKIADNLITPEELTKSLVAQYQSETGITLLKASDFFERLNQPDAKNIQINLELKAGSRGQKPEALERAKEEGLTEEAEHDFCKFLLNRTYLADYNQYLKAPSNANETLHMLKLIQMLETSGLSQRTHILSLCPNLLESLDGLNSSIPRSLMLQASDFDLENPWQSLQNDALPAASKAKVNDLSLEAQFFIGQLSDKEPIHQQIADLRGILLQATGKSSEGFSVWSVDDPDFAKDLIESFGSQIDFIVSNQAIPVLDELKKMQLQKEA